MKRRRIVCCVPALALALLWSAPWADATSIQIDGGWTILESPENQLVTAPYFFTDGSPWTISPIVPVKLTVTDLFSPGDLFRVWINDSILGTGSGIDGYSALAFADTPDEAVGDPNFSQNTWILPPGTYSIRFEVTAIPQPFTNTALAFKVESWRVDDGGGTLALLAITISGIAGVRSRLKKE